MTINIALMSVGERSIKMIVNSVCESSSLASPKNEGIVSVNIKHIANITMQRIALNVLNGLQSLRSIARPVNVIVTVSIVVITGWIDSATSVPSTTKQNT